MPRGYPKRTEEREPTGHNHWAGENKGEPKPGTVRAPGGSPLRWAAPGVLWQDPARRWYLSLKKSGQSRFYEQSDIETAWFLANELSLLLEQAAGRSNRGEILRAVMTGMSLLLNTETDRRRAGIELVREEIVNVDPAKVAKDAYKEMLKKPALRSVEPPTETAS